MSESGQPGRADAATVRPMVTVPNPVADVPAGLPPAQVCEQARLSRDSRFDGLFYTAVTSTGIYCRPVCPAPAPRAANVRYYASAAAAEAAGFRPCLRCRPELAPAAGPWRRGDALLARALALIEDGALAQGPLSGLADRLHLGERQLRRLFSERLGASPVAVHGTRRLLFAKQLLTETAMPVTEVALAAGFGSLRRFHTVFRSAYRMPPGALRRRGDEGDAAADGALELRLAYRPPYDFGAILGFLGQRSLAGLDAVVDGGYERCLGPSARCRIEPWGGADPALRLRLRGVAPGALQGVVATVRRVFDLDAEPPAVAAVLAGIGLAGVMIARRLGLAGAPIVGPMILSGLAHALGLTSAKVPVEVLTVAQVSVGVLLGCQFRGLTWSEFRSTMIWGLLNTAALLVLTALVVSLVSRLTGFDQVSVLLAFAPGGQTELNLLTYVLGLDVAYVALHHLARLAIVILGAQLVFRTRRDWRKDA